MTGRRPTIAGLGALITLIALTLAAWKDGSFGSWIAVQVGSVLAFQFAIVAAVKGSGRPRRFWTGFVLGGLPYLIASQEPANRPFLPTSAWIDRITRPGSVLPYEISSSNIVLDMPTSNVTGPRTEARISIGVVGPCTLSLTGRMFDYQRPISHLIVSILIATSAGSISALLPIRTRAKGEALDAPGARG